MSEVKVSLHTNTILNEVKVCHRVVENKKTIEYSEAIILEFNQNQLTLKGTDGNIYFTSEIEISNPITDNFAVNRDLFLSTLNAVGKEYFTLIKNNNNVSIEAYNDKNETVFKSTLNFIDIDNVPKFPETNIGISATFNSNFLKDVFAKCFCVYKGEDKPALKGISVQKVNDELNFSASDSHRLSVVKTKTDIQSSDFSFILFPSTVSEIKRITSDSITLNFLESNTPYIVLTSEKRMISYPVIQAQYPVVNRLFKDTFTQKIMVKASDLKHLVESVSFIANKNNNNVNKLLVNHENNNVQMNAINHDFGSITNTLEEININNPLDFAINLNNAYLKEIINVFKVDENIVIEFEGKLLTLYAEKEQSFKHLIIGLIDK